MFFVHLTYLDSGRPLIINMNRVIAVAPGDGRQQYTEVITEERVFRVRQPVSDVLGLCPPNRAD